MCPRIGIFDYQQQVVVGGAEHGADELVVLAQVDADEAARARGVEVGEPRLLHQAGARGEMPTAEDLEGAM